MPTEDEIRARREKKAQDWRERNAPARRKNTAKVVLLSIAGILAMAGIVAGFILLQPEDDVHIHPIVNMYVNGTRVDLSDRDFDLSSTGYMRGHLHLPKDSVVHVEGRPHLTIGEWFRNGLLGSKLGSDYIELHSKARPANVTGHQSWPSQLLVREEGGSWHAVGGNPADYEFKDRGRVLLVYGPATDEQLEAWKAALDRDPGV